MQKCRVSNRVRTAAYRTRSTEFWALDRLMVTTWSMSYRVLYYLSTEIDQTDFTGDSRLPEQAGLPITRADDAATNPTEEWFLA